LCGNQHLQPQRLRSLVEGAVAHLERARIRDTFANHMHIELRPSQLFEISGTRTRYVQIGFRVAARWRSNDAGVEKTSTRFFDYVCDFMHGVWRDRIAVDDQRIATRGAQRIRRYLGETYCGTRIHDREDDIALVNEPPNRANIC